MDYPLQSMLRIRTMREDRAGSALTAARQARTLAEAELERRHQDRERYLETCEERRDRVFDQVMGIAVPMDQLDRVRAAVAKIDEEGVALQRAELDAEDALEARTREADAARRTFALASRNRMKIDEHKNIWTEEVRIEEERAADAEMEEFTGKTKEAEQ